jgi:hypothetical protein
MKTAAFLLLLCAALSADVVVLKSGARVGGRVVDKNSHYEVTTEGVLRTFLKEEVDKVLTSPKELLGDADASFEAAKKDYEAAVSASGDQQGKFKEAIAKITRAREAYTTALDLFPEDNTLGSKIMLIMQLLRLCRERLHSEIAGGPATGPVRPVLPTEPVGGLRTDDSLAVLLDPVQRADPAKRASAISAFRSQRTNNPESYDLATAAILFLSQVDGGLKLEGPALKAVQDYFDKGWLKDPKKLTPAVHQEAATWLAAQIPALRKAETAAAVELLQGFALVHASLAPRGAESEKAARTLGYVVQNGRVGTAEGHAVRDLDGWISNNDFDLAVLAFTREYRGIDTPIVRYVWSYALLRTVQAKKRGFERPVSALATITLSDPSGRDHLAALSKSISAVAICNVCAGEGRSRCTNCHGQKETKIVCAKCKGKGHSISSLGAQVLCLPCKGTGFSALIKCEKCKDGYFDCRQCGAKKKSPPEMDDICDAKPCDACEGRGLAFRSASIPCRSCLGLGMKLAPKSDPTKVLK